MCAFTPFRHRSAKVSANWRGIEPFSKKYCMKVMVDLAFFMSASIVGEGASTVNRMSILLPATIGASVCASIVGKKLDSPSVIGGIFSTFTTWAQPMAMRRTRARRSFARLMVEDAVATDSIQVG